MQLRQESWFRFHLPVTANLFSALIAIAGDVATARVCGIWASNTKMEMPAFMETRAESHCRKGNRSSIRLPPPSVLWIRKDRLDQALPANEHHLKLIGEGVNGAPKLITYIAVLSDPTTKLLLGPPHCAAKDVEDAALDASVMFIQM